MDVEICDRHRDGLRSRNRIQGAIMPSSFKSKGVNHGSVLAHCQ